MGGPVLAPAGAISNRLGPAARPLNYSTLFYIITSMNHLIRYQTRNNTVFSALYHVAWVTKYRRDVLDDTIIQTLKQIIVEIADGHDFDIRGAAAAPDRVEVLLALPPNLPLESAVRRLKGESARRLTAAFPRLKSRLPVLWSGGYFASTLGGTCEAEMAAWFDSQPRSESATGKRKWREYLEGVGKKDPQPRQPGPQRDRDKEQHPQVFGERARPET